mmetsp:Transcript_13738/g.38987  ORF Transcript_13738/g.38987 Transcript_13738/m.38987 type:complete len:291 (+) Transcript_13738:691-1563(+)
MAVSSIETIPSSAASLTGGAGVPFFSSGASELALSAAASPSFSGASEPELASPSPWRAPASARASSASCPSLGESEASSAPCPGLCTLTDRSLDAFRLLSLPSQVAATCLAMPSRNALEFLRQGTPLALVIRSPGRISWLGWAAFHRATEPKGWIVPMVMGTLSSSALTFHPKSFALPTPLEASGRARADTAALARTKSATKSVVFLASTGASDAFSSWPVSTRLARGAPASCSGSWSDALFWGASEPSLAVAVSSRCSGGASELGLPGSVSLCRTSAPARACAGLSTLT